MTENQKITNDENESSEELIGDGREASAEETDTTGLTRGVEDENEENRSASDEDPRMPPYTDSDQVIRRFNARLLGVMTLHYPSRDVKVTVDGDAAMRILKIFQTRSDQQWRDYLDPHISLASRGWLVVDLEEALAVSYMPLGQATQRTAIDPAPVS